MLNLMFIDQRIKEMNEGKRYRFTGEFHNIIKGFGEILVTIIFIYLLMICFGSLATGAQTTNSSLCVGQITDNSIQFNVCYKNSVRATGATFDGVEIEGFDLSHNTSYVARDLSPNSNHTFCIYKDLINCENATTLQEPQTNQEGLTGFIFAYIWWIIAVCLLVGAIAYKSSMIGFISAISCLVGMVKGVSDSSFIVFILYLVTFICAYLVTEQIKEG